MKAYAKNSNNRKNISWSIGRKIQYNFANRLMNGEGLNDEILAAYVKGSQTTKVRLIFQIDSC